uniref:Yippee domain-containing protein n=1 Tax=Corethron hystrix TaxID=216773 RepID=A0A7S1B8P9_9STRA|mmetsp:Transcript_17237/g.38883  ORF Transcript_17237/g.38883 Transcript_17237/m.38883 type:complete len:382 (+) Transcript_17237:835-1980(+)
MCVPKVKVNLNTTSCGVRYRAYCKTKFFWFSFSHVIFLLFLVDSATSNTGQIPGGLLVSRYLTPSTEAIAIPASALSSSSIGPPSSASSGMLPSRINDQSEPPSPIIALEVAAATSSSRIIRTDGNVSRRQLSSASTSRNVSARARLRIRSRSRSIGQTDLNRNIHILKTLDEKMVLTKTAKDTEIYLEGPRVYTCSQCRTHLTSHDDIISKSFHGRHGRAYLFDQCVNVTAGPPEDRLLITGLHSVCDIFCNRCKELVGWTYSRAYEPSQKYKEGKFIIEKINLHMEESQYDVNFPAGERIDRWRKRSMSWGNNPDEIIYEYRPKGNLRRARSLSLGSSFNVASNSDQQTGISKIDSSNSTNITLASPARSMSLPYPSHP